MHTRKLESNDWRRYFDWLSHHMPTIRAEIEVDSLDLGGQITANTMVIDGISYDPYSREVVITATDVHIEHHISDPREISVIENGGLPSAFEIVDGDGRKQILRLTPLQELPRPAI